LTEHLGAQLQEEKKLLHDIRGILKGINHPLQLFPYAVVFQLDQTLTMLVHALPVLEKQSCLSGLDLEDTNIESLTSSLESNGIKHVAAYIHRLNIQS
jgi:hypothetical protein